MAGCEMTKFGSISYPSMSPNGQNEVSKKIIIQVGGPCHKVRRASVVQSQKVDSLVKLFKENIELLFMGEVLMPNRTFAFYGVEEGSFITVVPKAEAGHNNNINTWQAVTKDSDFFNNMIGFASNAHTAEELARLKDIRMMRLMAKNGRQITNTLALQNIDGWRRTVTTRTIIGKAPHAPSCEPLPYIW